VWSRHVDPKTATTRLKRFDCAVWLQFDSIWLPPDYILLQFISIRIRYDFLTSVKAWRGRDLRLSRCTFDVKRLSFKGKLMDERNYCRRLWVRDRSGLHCRLCSWLISPGAQKHLFHISSTKGLRPRSACMQRQQTPRMEML